MSILACFGLAVGCFVAVLILVGLQAVIELYREEYPVLDFLYPALIFIPILTYLTYLFTRL